MGEKIDRRAKKWNFLFVSKALFSQFTFFMLSRCNSFLTKVFTILFRLSELNSLGYSRIMLVCFEKGKLGSLVIGGVENSFVQKIINCATAFVMKFCRLIGVCITFHYYLLQNCGFIADYGLQFTWTAPQNQIFTPSLPHQLRCVLSRPNVLVEAKKKYNTKLFNVNTFQSFLKQLILPPQYKTKCRRRNYDEEWKESGSNGEEVKNNFSERIESQNYKFWMHLLRHLFVQHTNPLFGVGKSQIRNYSLAADNFFRPVAKSQNKVENLALWLMNRMSLKTYCERMELLRG